MVSLLELYELLNGSLPRREAEEWKFTPQISAGVSKAEFGKGWLGARQGVRRTRTHFPRVSRFSGQRPRAQVAGKHGGPPKGSAAWCERAASPHPRRCRCSACPVQTSGSPACVWIARGRLPFLTFALGHRVAGQVTCGPSVYLREFSMCIQAVVGSVHVSRGLTFPGHMEVFPLSWPKHSAAAVRPSCPAGSRRTSEPPWCLGGPSRSSPRAGAGGAGARVSAGGAVGVHEPAVWVSHKHGLAERILAQLTALFVREPNGASFQLHLIIRVEQVF